MANLHIVALHAHPPKSIFRWLFSLHKLWFASVKELSTSIKAKSSKNVHATTPKGNMGYVRYTVLDTVAVEPTFVAFL